MNYVPRRADMIGTGCCAVLLFCGSCSDVDRTSQASATHEIPVAGKLLSQAPAIGQPWDMQLVGTELWVVDAAGNPDLHILDNATGGLLRSLGRRGGGPGEIAGAVTNIQADPWTNAAVWVFDGSSQRLTRFSAAGVDTTIGTVTVTGSAPFFKAAWLTPDVGIGIAGDPERRFTQFDASGSARRTIEGEILGPPGAPLDQRIRATVSTFSLCVRPSGSHFAIAYADAGRVEIRDSETFHETRAQVPDSTDAIFTPDEDSHAIRFRRTRIYYVGCASTESSLYVLFSGMPYTRETSAQAMHAETVQEYDWSGNLKSVTRISPRARGLTVSPDGMVLYTVTLHDAAVYSYTLTGSLQ